MNTARRLVLRNSLLDMPGDVPDIGDEIYVRWIVKTSGGKQAIWWKSRVLRVHIQAGGEDFPIHATISYEARLSHEAAVDEILFNNGRFLRSADEDSIGELNLWRPKKQGRASRRTTAHSEGNAQEIRTFLQCNRNREPDCPQEDDNAVSRIDRLEAMVAGLQASLSVLAPQELSWKSIAGRPLAFTRSKLNEAFARAIPQKPSAADGRSRASKQDFFRASADCTLKEFLNVARVANALDEVFVHFEPCFASLQSSSAGQGVLCIYFESLQDICRMLAGCGSDELRGMVWTERRERRTARVTALRVVGTLAAESNADGPMTLAVGRAIHCFADVASSIRVLHRESQWWDPMEQEFSRPLTILEMTPQRAGPSLARFSKGAPSEGCFAMRWTRTERVTARGPLSTLDTTHVCGILDTFIPIVYFRSVTVCEELCKIVNEDSLRDLMRS